MKYADFWIRFGAVMVDVVVIVYVTLGFIVASMYFNFPQQERLGEIFIVLFFLFYFSIMESSSRQATVGKIILGLKVTSVDGNKISFLHAIGRTLAKLLSVITLGIGFLMVGFTKKKQGLHDVVTDVVVVKNRESRIWNAFLSFIFSVLLIIGAVGLFIIFFMITVTMKGF